VPLTASFVRIEKKLPDGAAGLTEHIEKLQRKEIAPFILIQQPHHPQTMIRLNIFTSKNASHIGIGFLKKKKTLDASVRFIKNFFSTIIGFLFLRAYEFWNSDAVMVTYWPPCNPFSGLV